MPLIDFKTYRESSPSTRNKWAAALGLQPPYSADVYGHSTPIKFVADKLKEKIGGKKKKGSPKEQPQVDESHDQKPDYSFDRLINKANKVAKEVDDEVEKSDEEEEKLDKEIGKKKTEKKKEDDKKSHKPFPPKKPEGKGVVHAKSNDDDEGDPLNSDDVSEWQQAWAEMEADIESRTSNKGW
jgi:hypothetical protein